MQIEQAQFASCEIESVQEDKKVEEEILNRNIKLRAIDLLNNQRIDKDESIEHTSKT